MEKVSSQQIKDFKAQLPGPFLDKFERLVGAQAFERLVTGYHNVARWQRKDPQFADLKLPTETNLEHIQEMLVLVNYVERDMPDLAGFLDMETVRLMVLIHDVGEIITGDITYADQKVEDAADRHQSEEEAAHRLITFAVQDRAERSKLIKVYDRYEANKSKAKKKDLEALFVKFIDIIQALKFGGENIFPPILEKMKRDGVPEDEYFGSGENAKVNNLSADKPARLLAQFEGIFGLVTRQQSEPEKKALALQQLIALMKAGMKVLEDFNDSKTIQIEVAEISRKVGEIVMRAVPKADLPI